MINVAQILYEICNNENVFNPEFDLVESGLLDSFATIELFSALEDEGVIIQPTRIDRSMLRTPGSIQQLVNENSKRDY